MFKLEYDDDRIRVTWNGQQIVDYRLQPDGLMPFWHPLRLPGAPALTMDRPPDHVHHHGMWLAWKKVNGVNFWEEPGPETSGYGRIVHQRVPVASADAAKARLTTESAWIDWRGAQLMADVRETTVHAPGDGYMVIDVGLRLSALEQGVTLDLMRGDPGRGGLFYSGLAIRFANAMSPGKLLDADGRTEAAQIFGRRSAWCGYAGEHVEDGRVYGIAVIDHPDNPRHPTTWWVRNRPDYALLHPSPTYHERLYIPGGDSVRFRYRIVLHRGHTEPDAIERLGW